MPDFSLQARVSVEGAQAAASNLNDVSNAISGAEKSAEEASKNSASTFSGLSDSAQQAADTIDKALPAAFDSAASSANATAQSMQNLASSVQYVGGAFDGIPAWRAAFDELMAKAAQVEASLGRLNSSYSSVFGNAKKEVSDFVQSTVPAYEEEQKQLRSWTVQLGTSTAAMEKLQEAKQLAAESEFDLASLRKAQQALVNLGVKGTGALKAVALAAQGTNRDVESTAQIMAKALAGSSRGFMQLQYGYGIKAEDLQKFGAVLGEEGQVLTDTAEQAEKARQALEALAAAKWGSAFSESAGSVTQTAHDMQESIETLRGNIGEDLAPLINTAKGTIQQFFEALNWIPAPVRKLTVWIAGVTAALAALVAGLPAAVSALTAAGTAATAFGVALKAGGAIVLSFGGFITGLMAAGMALNAVFIQWQKNAKAAGDEIKRSADIATAATSKMRGNVAAELSDVYKTEGAEGVKAFMAKNGWSEEEISAELQRIEAFKTQLKKEIQALQDELAGKDTSKGENAEKQAILENLERQYNIYGRAANALRESGYTDTIKDNSKELKKKAEEEKKAAEKAAAEAKKAAEEAKKAAEERLRLEKGITAELLAQKLAALKTEQAGLYRKADRTETEQARLEALKSEILAAEKANISARLEDRFSEVEKGTKAYKELLELQDIYIKNAEKAQAELQQKDAEAQAKRQAEAEKKAATEAKKAAEERAKAEKKVTAELQKQTLIQLKAEREKLLEADEKDAEALKEVQERIEQIVKAQTEEDFKERFAEVEKGTKAYKDLMKAKELAITAAISAERRLQEAEKQTNDAEKDALQEQIELIKQKYAERQKELDQNSERSRALKNAEIWEIQAAKDKDRESKKAASAMTWREYREREAGIYEEFRRNTEGLSRTSAAYSSFLKSRDFQLGALSEEYRTGKTALPDALNTMTENVQTGAQSVQSGLSSLSDVLNSGAADVQSGLSSLASALSTASLQAQAKTGAGGVNNAYNINIAGNGAGRSVESDTIAAAAARLVTAEQRRQAFFGG